MANPAPKPSKKIPKLTHKQAKFIDEYLIDLNATQAAIRAGYSKNSADVIGIQNLGKLRIAEQIQKRRDKLKEKAEINQEWVLERYKRLLGYRVTDFFNDDGTIKALSEISDDAIYAIQGLDVDTRTIKDDIKSFVQKFKLPDKRAALDSIAKLLGLVVEKQEVSHKGQIAAHVYGYLDKESNGK